MNQPENQTRLFLLFESEFFGENMLLRPTSSSAVTTATIHLPIQIWLFLFIPPDNLPPHKKWRGVKNFPFLTLLHFPGELLLRRNVYRAEESMKYLAQRIFLVKETNRPFPSSVVPLFQSEWKCENILMKMTFICMKKKPRAELIFIWKVSHLDSLWNRGTRELGNGLFSLGATWFDDLRGKTRHFNSW